MIYSNYDKTKEDVRIKYYRLFFYLVTNNWGV